jgi:2,5-furandicarboxylate decarboxylase 1
VVADVNRDRQRLAALSVADMKHVTVVEDDIDVFDLVDVDWAVATRVQADRDVLVISNARAKPLDPSLVIVPGKVPTTAKMGIDATIADDVPRERFHRIAYAYADRVKLEDYLGEGADAGEPEADTDVAALAAKVRAVIETEPKYFAELAELFEGEGFQNVARALGALHEDETLWQDAVGRFCLKDSEFAASPPTA